MEKGYKIETHYTSHDPKQIKKVLGEESLLNIIKDLSKDLSGKHSFVSNPLEDMDDTHFDMGSPIIIDFMNSGGPDLLGKILKCSNSEALTKLANLEKRFINIKVAEERNTLRFAYMALQNFLDKNNEAAKMERVAYKNNEKSSGYWQIEAINAIDKLKSFANNERKNKFVKEARQIILSNDKKVIAMVAKSLHNWYSEITPKENRRVAYTTLSTQTNEPYLLCPKGKFQGYKAPVPMEISKCVNNCIDSRLDKDGHVTCGYQDWLKVAFQTHDEVMARLDVHTHPDNEANALELKEGERSKKLTEGEVGYEARFNMSTQGANKLREKANYEDSIETQLSDNKAVKWGHQQDDKPVKRPKQAQSDHNRVINEQLSPERKNQDGAQYLEELLRKLNTHVSDTEHVREEQLDDAELMGHRGEMETPYSEQLLSKKSKPIYISEEINSKADDGDDMTVSQHLNKSASKVEKNQEQLLEENRKKSVMDILREEQLEERRTNKKDVNKTIEQLLSDSKEDWGHQYSDDDLKNFAHELGLDYNLEDLREDNDVV